MDPTVTAAWERVTASWDDAARHDAFMGLVAQHSCYAWAAARYKERAGDPVAERQLEKLRKAATVALLSTSSKRDDDERSPYTKTLLWLVAMVAMILLGLVLTGLLASHKRPSTRGERRGDTPSHASF